VILTSPLTWHEWVGVLVFIVGVGLSLAAFLLFVFWLFMR